MTSRQYVSVSVGLDERDEVRVNSTSARRDELLGRFLPPMVHVHMGGGLHVYGAPKVVTSVLREAMRLVRLERAGPVLTPWCPECGLLDYNEVVGATTGAPWPAEGEGLACNLCGELIERGNGVSSEEAV